MQMTRRFFLQSTGALACYLSLGSWPSIATAADAAALPAAAPVARGKTLVALFLRGGIDGLNLIVPHGDEHYYRHRRGLALPRPGADESAVLDLDGFFGLHPRTGSLKPLFEQGHAVALQAVGYGQNTRSHFEEQDTWETGVVGNTINSEGWLNRHLQTSEGSGPIRAIALSDTMPRVLRGKARAFAIQGLEDLGLPQTQGDSSRVVAALDQAYSGSSMASQQAAAMDLLATTGQTTLDALEQLQRVTSQEYKPKAEYPNSQIGRRLLAAARLIKANLGVEVIEIDYGDWDTHQYQGYQAGGRFGNQVQQLADALAAFHADLGDHASDTLVITLSDFGRTASENGTEGTDHGWANAMLALGGPITASAKARDHKPVVGQWPGLAPDQLNARRDLQHTTDFRDVLAEAVHRHLGNPNTQAVIPNHEFKPVNLLG